MADLGPGETGSLRGGPFLTHAVGLEQSTPRRDPQPALEQRPALSLRHAAPHPELGVVVQCIGKTFGDHRAAHAYLLGLLLGSTTDKQGVRLHLDAGSLKLSLIHISEPTRRTPISYAVFCLKK